MAASHRRSPALIEAEAAHQFTVSTSMLLVPPLEQPTSPLLPLGVITFTFTEPGPEITAVLRVTCSFCELRAVAASAFPFTTISDAGTKLLPVTVSVTPCCTSAKLTELGEIEPIMGAGRTLPQKGLRALLQPAKVKSTKAITDTRETRDGMGVLLPGNQQQTTCQAEPWADKLVSAQHELFLPRNVSAGQSAWTGKLLVPIQANTMRGRNSVPATRVEIAIRSRCP